MSDVSWRPDLHLRLARREVLLVRATRAAAAAALAAILGWLVGLGPGPHALAVLAGAAVAAGWPLPNKLDAAFLAIARQAGLAYQTHVEYHGRDDPHGLLSAAAVQARLSIRGVTPPRQGAWWLPLAALAVAIWLLATVVGGPGSWFASQPSPTPELGRSAPTPTPPTPPPGVQEPESEGEPELEDPPPEPAAAAPEPSRSDGGSDRGADDGAPEGQSEGLEREALDRFLDSLRERPRLSEEELAAAEAERDGVREDADADLEAAEVRGEAEGDEAERGELRPTDRFDEDAERDDRLDQVGGGDPREADGFEEADFGDESGDTEGFAEGESEEGDGQEGFEPSDDGVPQPESAGEEAGAPSLGDDEQGPDAGMGEDAGVGVGTPDEGHDAVPEPAGDLEALPGILRTGPESLGGRVRLPGRDTEVELQGGDVARYERAVEQAVTDGSVPVTYQEIIRNYFR
jgi:hypothetical protein